jgi:hypothetical protein
LARDGMRRGSSRDSSGVTMGDSPHGASRTRGDLQKEIMRRVQTSLEDRSQAGAAHERARQPDNLERYDDSVEAELAAHSGSMTPWEFMLAFGSDGSSN